MKKLIVLFAAILAVMIGGTINATRQQSIFEGGRELLRNPWGVMTLYDAYFGFLTFYAFVAYRERSWIARILWFIAIMLLGNIAMSAYMLIAIARLPKGSSIEDLLKRPA